jgi:hypothetical protein
VGTVLVLVSVVVITTTPKTALEKQQDIKAREVAADA